MNIDIGVSMICPMCDREVECFHKKSHIIPDSMHESAYDEKHRIVSVIVPIEKVKSEQTGAKNSIICNECENLTNDRADRYAAVLFKNHPKNLVEYYGFQKRIGWLDAREKAEFWEKLDFKKLQNFVFITVLRNELHLRTQGKKIIGEKHFERIKCIYNDDNFIDSEKYPIVILKNTPNEEDYKDVIAMPSEFELGNHRGVLFRVMGYVFMLFVASHKKHSPYERFFLQTDGRLIIRYEKFLSHKNNRKAYTNLARLMTDYKNRQNQKICNDQQFKDA